MNLIGDIPPQIIAEYAALVALSGMVTTLCANLFLKIIKRGWVGKDWYSFACVIGMVGALIAMGGIVVIGVSVGVW